MARGQGPSTNPKLPPLTPPGGFSGPPPPPTPTVPNTPTVGDGFEVDLQTLDAYLQTLVTASSHLANWGWQLMTLASDMNADTSAFNSSDNAGAYGNCATQLSQDVQALEGNVASIREALYSTVSNYVDVDGQSSAGFTP